MRKILLIEDDYYIGDIYERAFTNGGYQVEKALDGEAGLEKTKSNLYDVILLDIMLPKMNGIDVLRQLRAPNSSTVQTPIFMTTNLGQDNIIKEAFKIGADGYFIKAQLHPENLVGEINKYFAERIPKT